MRINLFFGFVLLASLVLSLSLGLSGDKSSTVGITFVVGLSAVFVSYQHLLANKVKFKSELYDRRFKVYETALRVIFEIVQNGYTTDRPTFFNDPLLNDLKRERIHAGFIMGEDIFNYLDEILTKANRLNAIHSATKNNNNIVPLELCDEDKEIMDWFFHQIEGIRFKFKPHLDIVDDR